MSRDEIVKKYRSAKESIENSNTLSQVEKDIAVYRKWRTYSNDLASLREPATIILTHKKE
jgi:hypothetical protein